MMALFNIWLRSKQRGNMVVPLGRTVSHTIMLLHQFMGCSTSLSLISTFYDAMTSSFAFTFSTFVAGTLWMPAWAGQTLGSTVIVVAIVIQGKADWLTHSSQALKIILVHCNQLIYLEVAWLQVCCIHWLSGAVCLRKSDECEAVWCQFQTGPFQQPDDLESLDFCWCPSRLAVAGTKH